MKAQTCSQQQQRVKTAANVAEKPRNIQKIVDVSHVRRRSLEAFSRSRYTANETQVRLSQEQPSDEDQYWQNSTVCVDGHRGAVQEKDTAHMKHLAHGAKRDTKLKYRIVVLEVLSRPPRRDRVPHSRLQLTMPRQSSADQTEKIQLSATVQHEVVL